MGSHEPSSLSLLYQMHVPWRVMA